MFHNYFKYLTILLPLLSSLGEASPKLGLNAFLEQVQENHLGVKAAREASRGAEERRDEGDLLFHPQAFAEVQLLDDQQQKAAPSSQGTRTQGSQYRLGVSGQTRFGLKGRVFTESDYANLSGTSPMALPMPKFHDGRQTLELTQPLWKNAFGSELRATEEAVKSTAEARSLSETFRAKAAVTAAEAAYWRLAAARETVQVKQESLARAQKIREWTMRREALDLGKKSDVLQAESAVKLAELDLQAVKDQERAAAWAFNSARGSNAESVSEELDKLSTEQVLALKPASRGGDREDVRAAEAVKRASQANVELSIEKHKPSLDLSASVSLTGKDTNDAWAAYKNSFSTDHPVLGLGVKFSTPLDFGLVSQARAGYRREAHAAEMDLQRKKFEQDREWKDLERGMQEAKRRLELSVSIESAQQEKWVNEKKRHDVGRTTTYQVLIFEQDYATAQLQRIKLETDVLLMNAQMKLFAAEARTGGAR